MEKIVEQAMLYDFYGELLNDHQKSIFEEYVLDNFSLSEIAEEHGISRQGVHDMIKRTDKTLNEYEEKLHLVRKFMAVRENVNKINAIAKKITGEDNREAVTQITHITETIIDEL
ncbi:MAG TPA: YlxM family DNA-binding protein [Lachnospiraceae bacterium]|jgi:predicted DNA-binding protein YlxM (UPF0122 family)|nr:uPF0122 protein BUTYVIB_00051 [Butyrivibrio sp. CAG:318]HJI31357.1 YlxM family DNA-binding protein [Lachnospiraceae bacterium]